MCKKIENPETRQHLEKLMKQFEMNENGINGVLNRFDAVKSHLIADNSQRYSKSGEFNGDDFLEVVTNFIESNVKKGIISEDIIKKDIQELIGKVNIDTIDLAYLVKVNRMNVERYKNRRM